MVDEAHALYRRLPSVSEVLESAAGTALQARYSPESVTVAVRTALGAK